MKWTLLLNFALISYVVADGAWKDDFVYQYKFVSKSVTALPTLNTLWIGANFNAFLTINTQSENLLIGRLSGAKYAEIELSDKWDPNTIEMQYKRLPLTKPFEIHLKNGAIDSLSVDSSTTNDQINQLKVILSQLQIDPKSGNNDSDVDSANDFFKKTEQTITGNCETTYDITSLPEHAIYSDLEVVPLAQFVESGTFFNIVKTRNYNNCTEIIELMNERGSSQAHDNVINSEANRFVLTGSKKNYTILSSSTTNRVVSLNSQFSTTIFYVKLTLQSMGKRCRQPEIQAESLVAIRSLIYNQNLQSNLQAPFTLQDEDIRWSECYTTFIAGSTMCKHSFSAEWEVVGVESGCGYSGFGQRAACKHSFPRCDATSCWSLFLTGLCDLEFGSRLPVKQGDFQDCSPGFYRERCCPN